MISKIIIDFPQQEIAFMTLPRPFSKQAINFLK